MILCEIKDAGRYAVLSGALKKAIEWLQNYQPDDFVKGVIDLGVPDGFSAEILVKCQELSLVPRENARPEAHHRFIDIQVPLKGAETMGWAPVDALHHLQSPYSEEKDVEFYGDSAHSLLDVKVGQMVVFFPEDAHAPNIGLGNHRKLCIKVPVE